MMDDTIIMSVFLKKMGHCNAMPQTKLKDLNSVLVNRSDASPH